MRVVGVSRVLNEAAGRGAACVRGAAASGTGAGDVQGGGAAGGGGAGGVGAGNHFAVIDGVEDPGLTQDRLNLAHVPDRHQSQLARNMILR